jgi:curved DNA-binding protein
MTDYYKTLGVDRQATPDAIKRAYRQKASLYHPDKEGGSKVKFQEVEEAYRTLSDPAKRQQYDNPSPFNGGGGFGPFAQNAGFDIDSIFSMFGTRFHGGGPQFQRRAQMSLWITLEDSARGGRRVVSVGTQQGTQTVEIEIPLGIDDGDSVQYPAIGPGGMDLIITYRIHPNPKYQRQGSNIVLDQPVSIWDLVLGGNIEIRDVLNNKLDLYVPARCQPGTLLRLKGRGMPVRGGVAGDLLVRVQARIPDHIDLDLVDLIEKKRNQ